MHRTLTLAAAALLVSAGAAADSQAPVAQHFDPTLVDPSVDPCTDFYAYACATWQKQNPIPPDRGAFGRGAQLQQRNQAVLREILDGLAAPGGKRTPTERQVGDYYAACVDGKAIDGRGLAPLQRDLGRVAALKDKKDLAPLVADLQAETFTLAPPTDSGGTGFLFFFSQTQDLDDAHLVVAGIDQGGLGLPDRDYYLKDTPEMAALRDKYQAHVARMLGLAGDPADRAAAEAQAVVALERALAGGAMDIVKRRDPANLNHKLALADVQKLAPSFDWARYLKAAGAPATHHYLVGTPGYLQALEAQLKERPLDDWKAYLRWHLVHAAAKHLPQPFVDEDFAFYGKEVIGAKELAPAWRRCAIATDRDLGEALGQIYADRTFGAEGKRRMMALVTDLRHALDRDIDALDWMSAATKKEARAKLGGILDKIGYPDKPRDYSSVKVSRGDALGNAFAAGRFELRRQLAKIGKPIDRGEWTMTPPTVNAYYDPQMNTINFPAGILQPPYFDATMDDAVNYGSIGSVIGHELTHGFDDQGRKFDATGNLRDWWTAEDGKKFDERAACVADEYSGFEPLPGLHVNGRLTLGENTADNGGVRIALMALHDRLAADKKPAGDDVDKKFFLAYAQGWCANFSDAALRTIVNSNPHSPSRFRVNGVLQNLPEFHKAYACKPGQKMVSPKACRVW